MAIEFVRNLQAGEPVVWDASTMKIEFDTSEEFFCHPIIETFQQNGINSFFLTLEGLVVLCATVKSEETRDVKDVRLGVFNSKQLMGLAALLNLKLRTVR